MKRAHVAPASDEPAVRVEIECTTDSVYKCEPHNIIVNLLDFLPANQFELVATRLHFVQSKQFTRQFNPVAQSPGRSGGLFHRISFAFPLPAALAVGRFGVNPFTASADIDT